MHRGEVYRKAGHVIENLTAHRGLLSGNRKYVELPRDEQARDRD